jgi:Fic family protein
LIATLTRQEAKDSSEIENIVTTHDELFRSGLDEDLRGTPAAKEVRDYSAALRLGFSQVQKTGLLRLKDILDIQAAIQHNNAGLRKLPGTTLKNPSTQEVVYVPPQHPKEIESLLSNLLAYINDTSEDLDPLIKMAVIHHQFESIHPFYDGNGRVGRIINILYLVVQGLLDLPILYLSRHITNNKVEYYTLLQQVRDDNRWEDWILFMITGVESTALETIALIEDIRSLMFSTKHTIRRQLPKIYSQDLLNNLFRHPYTKIAYLMADVGVTRITATRYLEQLVEKELLTKRKVGRDNYYINDPLCEILMRKR